MSFKLQQQQKIMVELHAKLVQENIRSDQISRLVVKKNN